MSAPVLAAAAASVLAVCYFLLVRRLRYARIDALQDRYGRTAEEMKGLGYKEAQDVLGQLGLYECPWLFLSGKDFAFLRVRSDSLLLFPRFCGVWREIS